MDERKRRSSESARQSESAAPRRRRKKKHSFIKNLLFWVGTLILVGILTAAMFVGIFLKYVDKSLKGHVEVNIEAYDPSVSSELYYRDPETGEEVMYQTLFLNAENRIWVSLDNIPKNLQEAAIAIEENEVNAPGVNADACRYMIKFLALFETFNHFIEEMINIPAEMTIFLDQFILETIDFFNANFAIIYPTENVAPT